MSLDFQPGRSASVDLAYPESQSGILPLNYDRHVGVVGATPSAILIAKDLQTSLGYYITS